MNFRVGLYPLKLVVSRRGAVELWIYIQKLEIFLKNMD
jgi:hypothetical protein